jgi:hypothetical protein
MWLGEADPVNTVSSRVDDPRTMELRDLLEAWGSVMGIGHKYRVTLKAVIDRANATKGGSYSAPVPVYPELVSALSAALGERRNIDALQLGNFLRSVKDRRVDGHWFAYKANKKGSSKWWIEAEDGSEKAGAVPQPPGKADDPQPGDEDPM